MGSGGDSFTANCFGLSGFFKMVESALVFFCMMYHRFGNGWDQTYYGASDAVLHASDTIWETEIDLEMIGTGATFAFFTISPLMLLAYAVEGKENVQATILDALFCLVGAVLFIGVGALGGYAWIHSTENISGLDRYDFAAVAALMIATVLAGIVYLIDFFYVMYRRAYYLQDE